MTARAPRFTVALVLSAAIHIGLLAAIALLPRGEEPPEEEPPEVVVLELAALGEPEAPEPAPEETPPPAPEPEPAPPPPEPEPEPEPVIEPEPEPVVEPEPEPEPEPPPPEITARPEPKPEPPKPPAPEPPPEVAAPQPPPEPAPAKPAPPAPAPAVEEAVKPPPKKGIETGVAGAVSQAEMSRYITTLFTMIDKRKVYPSQSLRRREEGTVIVRLKISAKGELLDVTSPTADPERLVEASLNAVRRAAPFPPLPKSFNDAQAEFQVPVVYKLQ